MGKKHRYFNFKFFLHTIHTRDTLLNIFQIYRQSSFLVPVFYTKYSVLDYIYHILKGLLSESIPHKYAETAL